MNLLEVFANVSAASPRSFLEVWHGPPTRAVGHMATPGALPIPIRELAATAVGWPSAFVQNHLVDDPKDVRDGDKRVFYAENQWVYVWATDGSAADPTVWGRYVGQGDRWQAEREPLSHFLLQILVFEAIMGGPYRAFGFGISLAQVEVALGPMRRLPLGSWRWPSEPGWFYASAQLLGFVNPSVTQPGAPTDRFDIMVAGRTADPLSYLAAIEGVEFAMATG